MWRRPQKIEHSYFQRSFFLANWISALLRVKNGIPRTTSILKSINKNVFWKIWAFPSLSFTWKLARTILNVSKIKALICWAPTLMLPCWSRQSWFFGLQRYFFLYWALAQDFKLIKQGVDNFGAQILSFSSWESFINWL